MSTFRKILIYVLGAWWGAMQNAPVLDENTGSPFLFKDCCCVNYLHTRQCQSLFCSNCNKWRVKINYKCPLVEMKYSVVPPDIVGSVDTVKIPHPFIQTRNLYLKDIKQIRCKLTQTHFCVCLPLFFLRMQKGVMLLFFLCFALWMQRDRADSD